MIMRLEISDAIAKEFLSPPLLFPSTHSIMRRRRTDFASKDNGKLRCMLEARKLATIGTRNELIARLEENPDVDYEQFTTGELSEMALRRHMQMGSTGPKALKIVRHELNDELKRGARSILEGELYGSIAAMEMIVGDFRRYQEKVLSGDYSFVKRFCQPSSILIDLLRARNLPESGSIATKIDRLRKNDATHMTPFVTRKFEDRINDARAEWEKHRVTFEKVTGRPLLSATRDLDEENKNNGRDSIYKRKPKAPRRDVPERERRLPPQRPGGVRSLKDDNNLESNTGLEDDSKSPRVYASVTKAELVTMLVNRALPQRAH